MVFIIFIIFCYDKFCRAKNGDVPPSFLPAVKALTLASALQYCMTSRYSEFIIKTSIQIRIDILAT